MSLELRVMRKFREAFKREKVALILSKKLTISDVSQTYQVSKNSVYQWVHKYGNVPKNERIVYEKTSEENKTKELLNRVKELEAELGRLHIENVFQKNIIECGSELIGEDLKKKFSSRQ